MRPHSKPAQAKAQGAGPRPAAKSRTAHACPLFGYAFSPIRPVLVSSLIGLLIILPL